jgi:SnoaL-like domain
MDAIESVRSFIRAWNIDSDDERMELLSACCDPQGVFVSPQGVVIGVKSFSTAIGAFRRAFPAADVVLGEPDTHKGYARFRWRTNWNDGREPHYGDDFVELSRDGLIVKVVSFDGGASPP